MDEWKNDIEKYLSGKMTSAERHALEKKALTDPFLADALEGAESVSPELFTSDIVELNQKITVQNKNRWMWPLRIAASVVGIALISTVIYLSIKDDDSQNLASNQKPKESEVVPKVESNDSLKQPELKKIEEDKTLASAGETKSHNKENKKSKELIALNKPDGDAKPASPEFESTLSGGSGVVEDQSIPIETAGPVTVLADSVLTTTIVAAMPVTKNFSISEQDDALTESKSKADVASRTAKEPAMASMDTESKRSRKSKPTNLVVSGEVRDQQGQPLPGVNISVKGSGLGAVTNADGKYSIALNEENPTLVYSFIGYVAVEQPVDKSKTEELNVQLQEDAMQLSEVVVTGYSAMKKTTDEPVVRLAEPVGGIKAYNQYLEDKKIYPQQALDNKIEGKVVIEFTVTIAGDVTDFNTVRKIGFGCDEELIRLVKEGPKWSPSYIDNVAVESLVRVKTKFEIK